jgi:hypothetical protein
MPFRHRSSTRSRIGPALLVAGSVWAAALSLQQCAPQPQTPKAEAGTPWAADMKTSLTIRELMTHFIDPTADFVFDAVVFDSNEQGTNHVVPVSEDDWVKVERGARQLAESANLLMIPRQAEPPGTSEPRKPGVPAPELPGPEIDAMIAADRPKWNRYSDALRVASLKALEMVKSRTPDSILDAGTEIDRACEACHLEYWYPGDRAAVEADAAKTVTFDPPKSATPTK